MTLKSSWIIERLQKFLSRLIQKENSSSYSAYSYPGIQSIERNLIIHEEKRKDITIVKEVWKCNLNYHNFDEFFL